MRASRSSPTSSGSARNRSARSSADMASAITAARARSSCEKIWTRRLASMASSAAAAAVTGSAATILPADDRRARNKIADAGFEAARKAKPAAFFAPRFETLLTTGNLEDDLAAAVASSDVIIEAIIENLAIKRQLYGRIDDLGGAAVIT